MERLLREWGQWPSRTPLAAAALAAKLSAEEKGLTLVGELVLPEDPAAPLSLAFASPDGSAQLTWDFRTTGTYLRSSLFYAKTGREPLEASGKPMDLGYLAKLRPDDELPKRLWAKTDELRAHLAGFIGQSFGAQQTKVVEALSQDPVVARLARYLPSKALVRLECTCKALQAKLEADAPVWTAMLQRDFGEEVGHRLVTDAAAEGISARTAFSRAWDRRHKRQLEVNAMAVGHAQAAAAPPFRPAGPGLYHPVGPLAPAGPLGPLAPRPVHPDIGQPAPLGPLPFRPPGPFPVPPLMDPRQPFRPQLPGMMGGPGDLHPFPLPDGAPRGPRPRFDPPAGFGPGRGGGFGGGLGGGGGFGGFI